MKTFLIKDLENISGVKAQTIRMWERRYHIFEPARSETNIRNYTVSDLKYLLQIVTLQQKGMSISEISQLSGDIIESHIISIDNEAAKKELVITNLIYCMHTMNIEEIEITLNNCVRTWGIDETISGIIIPFMQRAGITSYKDTSNETHFTVTALRRKLITAIESHNDNQRNKPTALLFLPSFEHYDLILLYMNYILRKKGINVLYLGTNISINNLHSVIGIKQPDIIFTYISEHNKAQHNSIFKYVLGSDPGIKLCVVSDKEKARSKDILPNFKFIHFTDFEEFEPYT